VQKGLIPANLRDRGSTAHFDAAAFSEMDGFNARRNVRIIASLPNRDLISLISASFRPGRFDRFIQIPMPNEEARLMILKIHCRKMKTSGRCLSDEIVSLTEG